MTPLHRGGCACGAIRYEIDADPVTIYACHCTMCQRQSGSAFGLIATFDKAHVAFETAGFTQFTRQAPNSIIRGFFCAACCTPIYYDCFIDSGELPFYGIKVGTLDDTGWVRVGCHLWTRHAQPWIRFASDDVVFREQPSLEQMPRFVRG
jgi:hypothetical protein